MKLKLKIINIFIIVFLLLFGINFVYAADNEQNLGFQFDIEEKVYKKDDVLTLEVKANNPNNIGINVISFTLNYNNEILEINKVYDEIEDEDVQDIKAFKSWEMNYDNEMDCVTLTRTDLYKDSNETICKINFKVKKEFSTENIRITEIESAGGIKNEYNQEEEEISLKGTLDSDNNIYLSTEKYKIGENDTQNYEEGDKYIYRISPKTTITEFLANLSTNGNIRVYNADGEEETNYDKFIGTGMRLQVTKDNIVIELTISVIGDINCDGDADITDLIAIRRHIQKLQEITRKEIVLSADINEDTSIDITDLVKIRKYIQQIEKL